MNYWYSCVQTIYFITNSTDSLLAIFTFNIIIDKDKNWPVLLLKASIRLWRSSCFWSKRLEDGKPSLV